MNSDLYEGGPGWGLNNWRSLFVLLALDWTGTVLDLIGVDRSEHRPLQLLARATVDSLDKAEEKTNWLIRDPVTTSFPDPTQLVHEVFSTIAATRGLALAEHLFILQKTSMASGARQTTWIGRLQEILLERTMEPSDAPIDPPPSQCIGFIAATPANGWEWCQEQVDRMSRLDQEYVANRSTAAGNRPEDAVGEMLHLMEVHALRQYWQCFAANAPRDVVETWIVRAAPSSSSTDLIPCELDHPTPFLKSFSVPRWL